MGFCPQCRAQEALAETAAASTNSPSLIDGVQTTGAKTLIRDRTAVGIGELDRVLGGGVVPGATVPVGGEPGVGKSTLLLQVADALAGDEGMVLIATAEESAHQVQMRARRVGVSSPGVQVASVYDVDDIIRLSGDLCPDALIVDSIQAISSGGVVGSAGGTAQVRDAAARLIAFAKSTDTPVVVVGHVTKDGSIAGPRTLEHMVDVVLYLEGESEMGLRFIRGIKNRFGSVNEVGVFEMTALGLVEVPDPSRLLIAQRRSDVIGSVLFPTVEGKRPMVVEIQALVVESDAKKPRRAVTGLAAARVHQIVGVVERHASMPLSHCEVYVSVMGGIRVSEPAADLPVALALASAHVGVPLRNTAAWGELGLTGDIRQVSRPAIRRSEVERLTEGPIIEPGDGRNHLFEVLVEFGFGSEIR